MARKYQKVQALLPEIQRMLDRGMSQREVAEAMGLEGDRPIHNLLKRERKKDVQVSQNSEAGSLPRSYRNTSIKTSG